jgi:hypothetical protein
MPVDLLAPVLGTRIRSVNFFNGRLLAGEDLTTEQKNNRIAHALLGKGIGDGVVYGLEVSESTQSSTTPSPVLSVTAGLAINKNGGSLLLEGPTEVSLVRPTTTTAATAKTFKECTPTQTGTYIAGAGVYLLTIGPTYAGQGLAEVNGISTATASCNTKYNVPGVQFRLIPLTLTQAELSDVNHLRNVVAYKCFGISQQSNSDSAFVTDPLNTPTINYGLLDDLRANEVLTNCEVPLAVMYWTATSGIVFVDMWAVRRPAFSQAPTETWSPIAGRRRFAEGLAMFLQFQEQINDMVEFGVGGTALTSIAATDYFRYLPPAGVVPIANIKGSVGFDYLQFFSGRTYWGPTFIEGATLEPMLHRSELFPPIDFNNQEMFWLYRERENMQSALSNTSPSAQPFILFANGHLPYEGAAQFNLSYWNYANYA